MPDIKNIKGISDADRKLIEDAEALIGPEPATMGFVKNLFWGNLREDLAFPYPQSDAKEQAECDQLLARLDEYLRNEHPSVHIDQEQEIPDWVIKKLFDLGVLGMTIPREYGGLGLGITSYNRVLERIGQSCGSTAVMVSAHQSIGCKAVMLSGTPEQKKIWLPKLAKEWLSAFCLSEPDVGCDAGGQRTTCVKSADGEHYILNGEKKWATSGALSGMFTVMARQKVVNPKTGKEEDRISALVCTPDMPGIDIFSKNRSKCGIRGTWQARIRFKDVKVPKFNLLGQEGRGLNIALSCLNYGRCTLSAGMLGGARTVRDAATKWSRTRFQFERPLSDFELVQARLANMAALCYAMDSVLYMTTGMLDRHDEDIMVETAICKVFCSEMGWRVVNDGLQIMGGEGYMTENEVERIFRDSRINLVVEGANEVMLSFVWAYGGKKLLESMLGVQNAVGWSKDEGLGANLARIARNMTNPTIMRAAIPLGIELFLGVRRGVPVIRKVGDSLRGEAERLCQAVREFSHQYKQTCRIYEEKLVTRQAVQARLAECAVYLHAWACTLSKLDRDLRLNADAGDAEFARDKAAALHFFDIAEKGIHAQYRALLENTDDTMLPAAAAAIAHSDTLPNAGFSIPESSPVAKGTGKVLKQDAIKQFPGDKYAKV
ncbi:MAG: acyl-CoA dehydrogenase family protein [Phycisphaerales bacterium]|nr:acyl-CoA dehydrogenase family protein [Phycisphaerales bacterium]